MTHRKTKLDTDLGKAFEAIGKPRKEGAFAIPTRILPVRKIKDRQNATARAMRRKMIRPENAGEIMDALPREEGDRMHAITCGNFVFGDMITELCKRRRAEAVTISTLSMSLKNIAALVAAMKAKQIGRIDMLVSNYFAMTNAGIFVKLEEARDTVRGFRLGVTRTHAKVVLFDFGAWKLVIESSANLRSSDNLEQVSAFADVELYDFHREWIEGLMT